MSQSTTTCRSSQNQLDTSADRVRAQTVGIPAEGYHFELTLLPDPALVHGVRETTANFVGRAGVTGAVAGDVVLVVSELVTNCILHGAGDICLRVWVVAGTVRVSVADEGTGQPGIKNVGPDAVSGRGLFLVASLASNWGTGEGETWAEFSYATPAKDVA
ncbi:ATP-binding protein [Streptomyces murinus]|uniref:ATP-binding protein n=1 Tax=Streptomyces murinus TaxID=33900 RepID=UPI003D666A8C